MAGALGDVRGLDAVGLKVSLPPVECGFAFDPERRAYDRVGAALFGGSGPVKKRDVGPRRSFAVAIEQMVGGCVVLIDCALDQPQAQNLGIKPQIFARIGGYGSQMVQSGKIEGHDGLQKPVFVGPNIERRGVQQNGSKPNSLFEGDERSGSLPGGGSLRALDVRASVFGKAACGILPRWGNIWKA